MTLKHQHCHFPILFLATLLLGSSALRADWILVDDFESYAEGAYTWNEGNLLYPGASNGGLGQTDIITEIEGTGGEKAAWFWTSHQISGGDFFHQIPLPVEISVNSVGTIYFRIWQSDKDLNWHVMISKVAAGDEPNNTPIWGNQAAILRYRPAEPEGSLYAHGGAYLQPQPAFSPALESWYEYWIILDNAYDGEVQIDTAGYSIYRKGPDDTGPSLMAWGTDQARTKLPMRNQAFESLKAIVLTQTQQDAANIWLIDDIYMTLGACLSDPRTGDSCESWCEFPVVGGHADTGSWLGWLYVATEPWVYSYALDGWLYIPDCPDATGGWVYVAR